MVQNSESQQIIDKIVISKQSSGLLIHKLLEVTLKVKDELDLCLVNWETPAFCLSLACD